MEHHIDFKSHRLAPRLERNMHQLANLLKLCHAANVFGDAIKLSPRF